jgi:tRNA nucleotidyltransferase/poly(A) polymerase
MTRDITINTIYYNLKKRIIEDPLNGIKDLQNAAMVTPLKQNPLMNNYLRVFRIFKASALLSFRIPTFLDQYFINNIDIIKDFMNIFKPNSFYELSKSAEEDFSLKIFKYAYDYKLIDVFIKAEYLGLFKSREKAYSNLIFNLALISEFLSKNFEKFTLDKDNKYLMIYKDIFNLPFEDVLKVTSKGNQQLYNVTSIAYKYCQVEDCQNNIIHLINLNVLKTLCKN